MHIQEEKAPNHSIQSYAATYVQIQGTRYTQPVLIRAEAILTPWGVESVETLTAEALLAPFALRPEIILLGQPQGGRPPLLLVQELNALSISLECMSLASACSTFNILLSEGRNVLLGILF